MSGKDKRCREIMNCEPFVPGKLDNRQALVGYILRLSGHSAIGQHRLGSLGVEGNGRVSQESTPSGEKMLSFLSLVMAKHSALAAVSVGDSLLFRTAETRLADFRTSEHISEDSNRRPGLT
jgi:hypothetical protein